MVWRAWGWGCGPPVPPVTPPTAAAHTSRWWALVCPVVHVSAAFLPRRYLGQDGQFGDTTRQYPPFEDWQQGQGQQQQQQQQSLDRYKRRLVAAFEFFHKLGVKYYSVSGRRACGRVYLCSCVAV